MLSFSKLKTYKDCQRKYRFKYVDHLPEPESFEAKLGTIGHKVLADYYQTTERSQELINVLCTRHGIEDDVDGLLKEILKGYHEWSTEQDKFLVVKELEKEYNSVYAMGRIDMVAELNGHAVIIDHKFKGQWSPNILEQLLYDEQTKTYSALTGINKVCYNLVRTKPAKTRPSFERICVLVPQTEINRIKEEYVLWGAVIESDKLFMRNRGYMCQYCSFKEQCYDYNKV